MNKSEILILTNIFRPNVGGAETHLDDLINEGSKDYFFYVLTYQPLVTKATGKYIETSKNYQIYRLPWLRFNLFLTLVKYPLLEFIYLFPGLFLLGIIFLFLKGDKIKVLHAHGLIAGTAAMVLGKIFGKRVIVSTHSIYNFRYYSIYQRFVQFVLNQVDHVLTLSTQSQKEIIRIGVNSEKVDLFVNWIDQNKFRPQSKKLSRERLKLSKDKFICLFVGRLVEEKGLPELLESASLLKNNKKVSLLIIGDGPLQERIKSSAQKLSNIDFKGRIDNQDLPSYYAAADVFIIPSTHEEGFGRVILEALSCGTPVIGSRRGAIPEIVSEDIGVLIDVTPENIKNAVLTMMADPKRLVKMSQEASKIAKSLYSSKNISMITKYYG